jgi:hypothetical protein
MGTVFAAASALVITAAGAATALSAPFGAAGHGGQYLAGHVLLGLGLGQSIAILLRLAVKRLAAWPSAGNDFEPSASEQNPPVSAAPPRPAAVAPAVLVSVPAARAATAPVTVLPAPAAALSPLRGRHAA